MIFLKCSTFTYMYEYDFSILHVAIRVPSILEKFFSSRISLNRTNVRQGFLRSSTALESHLVASFEFMIDPLRLRKLFRAFFLESFSPTRVLSYSNARLHQVALHPDQSDEVILTPSSIFVTRDNTQNTIDISELSSIFFSECQWFSS